MFWFFCLYLFSIIHYFFPLSSLSINYIWFSNFQVRSGPTDIGDIMWMWFTSLSLFFFKIYDLLRCCLARLRSLEKRSLWSFSFPALLSILRGFFFFFFLTDSLLKRSYFSNSFYVKLTANCHVKVNEFLINNCYFFFNGWIVGVGFGRDFSNDITNYSCEKSGTSLYFESIQININNYWFFWSTKMS